jgi:UDP-glucuronate 4-epimerase
VKIIVTGGAGFIGSNLVDNLVKQKHQVSIIDNFNNYYDPEIKRKNISRSLNKINLFEIDIYSDIEQLYKIFNVIKPDVVIHLAARAGVRPSIENPKLYIDTNVIGTFNILDACRLSECKKVIFASSSSVYGDNEGPFNEKMPILQTFSPYATTKVAGEHLCSNFVHLYGISIVCLRFFTVYGQRQRPDLAIHNFIDKIYKGIPIIKFGNGDTERDYTFIDDIVDGINKSIKYIEDKSALFDVFNLGKGQTTSLSTLISTIENNFDKKAIIDQRPQQKGDMTKTFADISKAKHVLGYNPKTSILQGIPKFIEWYLNK